MTKQTKLSPDVAVVQIQSTPDAWAVEAIEYEQDGAVETTAFYGASSLIRAERFAKEVYGFSGQPRYRSDPHRSAA